MLDYNIFIHAKPGFCQYMPHFNVFITEPVTTGFLLFFVVVVRGPWFMKLSGTGPDLEALGRNGRKRHRTYGNGQEQAGMSRESRRTMEKVRENTVYGNEKASFAARFSSTVRAALYHWFGTESEGLPDAMVATEFCIWALSPLRNLTTMVFQVGSVYPDSVIRSWNSSK